MKGHAVGYN